MNPIPLLLALAAAPVPPAGIELAQALGECRQLPIERQRACVEPYLDALPPDVAEGLRFETDPVLQAAAAAWQDQIEAALRERAAALAARGGARNLLAAAFVLPMAEPLQPLQAPTPDPQASAWFAAARTAAPADPLVAWIEAGDCQWISDDCDREAAIARLLLLDPGNAAVHLLAVGEATRRDDHAAIGRHFNDAATAERFEPFMPDMLSLVLEAHDGIQWPAPDPDLDEAIASLWGVSSPATADDVAAVTAFSRVLAISMPGLMPIARACPVGGLDEDAGRRADCMALLALLVDDSSAMYRQFALTQLSMHTAGDPAGDHWREQLRNAYWLVERSAALMPGMPGSGIRGSEYARLIMEKGEAGAMREVLRRNGVAAEAPADWRPSHPRQLALVTTGIPPGH